MLIAAPQNKRLGTTIKKRKCTNKKNTWQPAPAQAEDTLLSPPRYKDLLPYPPRLRGESRLGTPTPPPPPPPRLFFLLAPPSSAPLRLVPGAEVKLSEQADLHSPMAARMQMKRMVVGWGLAG